jgi:cell division control protein 6
MVNSRPIIVDSTFLSEDFMPAYIKEREHQIKWLLSALFPAVRGRRPVNVWIHGRSGMGKTCVSKFVLRKLQERWGNVRGVYVNCWRHNTLYAILDHIIEEMRILGGEVTSTSGKLDRFLKYVNDKPFIIILDEIDIPSPKERNSILYSLSRTGNVGTMCIARSEESYHKLDERVRSRMSARVLEFEPYKPEQVYSIVAERAARALKVGSFQSNVLDLVVEHAQGDVRIALEALKSAAEYAESEGNVIGLEHVHKGLRNIKQSRAELVLEGLTQHHRIIFNIIRERPDVVSGDLWGEYVDVCRKTGLTSLARRTFSSYLERLENLQLISSEQLNVMGKNRKFKATQ